MRILIFVALACSALSAQTLPNPVVDPGSNLPAYPIGPNDLVAVTVYGAPELNRTLRVDAAGFIRLPMLHERIKAQGMMPPDLEAAITSELEKEHILVEPFVTVNIAEYHSRPVTVGGAVKIPGTFQAIAPMRLIDALGKAGGLSDNAASEIIVTRRSGLEVRVSTRALIDAADPAMNLLIEGGETIRVPTVGHAFVFGNVHKPGAFQLSEDGGSTVLQMLAHAEGLTPFSSDTAYIYRRDSKGVRAEIPIELKKLLKRKAEDLTVRNEDILYIPESTGRKLTALMVDKILTFGSTAGATALVYSGVH